MEESRVMSGKSGVGPVLKVLRRLRQEDQGFKAILSYTVSLRLTWAARKGRVEGRKGFVGDRCVHDLVCGDSFVSTCVSSSGCASRHTN